MESTTEKIIRDDESLSDSDREFILKFKYNGKTAMEWEMDLNVSSGYDESGIPEWYTPMSMMTDTLALARTMLMVKDIPLRK